MSAIHKRLHYSQRIEFNLLAKLFKETLPPVYPYMIANGNQQLKQADFDDRIDVIPVSDPNIFSMSQRVMLAQEMMQMVQSNPEIHGPMGIYNAYKRMYEAMGVQQVDQILPPPPPPPQPQPTPPAMENSGFAMMQPAQPFPDQDHEAHIESHMSMYNTALVKTNPQVQAMIQSHVYAHVDMLARNQAQQDPEIMQLNQQMQMMPPPQPGQPPNPMQMQMQAVMERKVAQISAQLIEQLAPAFGAGDQEDPLVELRREELDIKASDIERKRVEGQERLDLDKEKLRQQTELTEDRIEAQMAVAEMRDETAQDRIRAQQAAQMANAADKITKNIFGR